MPDPHRPRVVLLGASNVTRAISTVVETARLLVGRPFDLLAAIGHGRSYGQRSCVCGRALPGISACGLWDALAANDEGPVYALVTDIGNDVMYGADPVTIGRWVDTCLERLGAAGASIVMTDLPLASVRRLTPTMYRIARFLLFPGRPLTLDEARLRAETLHAELVAIAERRGVHLEPLPGAWYGWDPIHIRRGVRREAFARLMQPWPTGAAPDRRARASLARWAVLRTATPEKWDLFGHPRGRSQPARCLADSSTVSFF